MANRRKTIEVRSLVSKLNGMLAADLSEEKREAVCGVIETVLHDTGNYSGFMYIDRYSTDPASKDAIDRGDYLRYRRRYFIPID